LIEFLVIIGTFLIYSWTSAWLCYLCSICSVHEKWKCCLCWCSSNCPCVTKM